MRQIEFLDTRDQRGRAVIALDALRGPICGG